MTPSSRAAAPVTSLPRTLARVLLGLVLLGAGISHLTVARQEFTAQVPEWMPVPDDAVVLGSGVVEIVLGAALVALPRRRVLLGWLAAAFFVAVFPGNVSQYLTRADAFGLDTDRARAVRLLFQPLLVLWALWSTGAWRAWRRSRRDQSRRSA
ncbi:DoxX family protein [Kocuria sp. CH-021]|uniref:DoxX family protein n=1 Tax=Kocuria sp. CH-021 TaxID=3406735 RepID=UPI003C753E1D